MDFEHEKRLAEVESRAKSNTHRLDDVERRQDSLDELVSSVKVLAVKQETVEETVNEIKGDVKELTGKSGKRWDATVDKIWLSIVAALAAFLLAKFGL